MVIYKITNKINGKIYIGQTTTSIKDRWKSHCKRKDRPGISHAIQKYGKENFTIEEIDGANSLSELNYLEEHYIYTYNSLAPNGYNLTSGGKNAKHSDETKKKMSESAKVKIFTEEHRRNIAKSSTGRANNKGKVFSEEWKRNMSISHKGLKRSDETKKKMIQARLGFKHTEETKRKISATKLEKKFNKI